MSLTVAEKAQVIQNVTSKLGLKADDTGSSETQIALLSGQIARLTEHLKTNKLDVHSRHGLIKLVSKRRRLLNYLKNNDQERYQRVLVELELRR